MTARPEEAARRGRRDHGDGRRRAHRRSDHRVVRGPEREVPTHRRHRRSASSCQLYFEEGTAEHVAAELAFAQSILETGSFGHALDNNYAGIGACDSCNGQIAFPTPRDGVRGQIQLLRNYADPGVAGRQPRQPAVAADLRPRPGRAPRSSTTRSSPRAARPPGTSWATATGRPTPSTRQGARPVLRDGRASPRSTADRVADRPVAGSEEVGEAAVGDGAEHEVAVDALDHRAGALGPRERRRRRRSGASPACSRPRRRGTPPTRPG